MNLPAHYMSFALHRLNTSAFVGRLSLHPLVDQRCSTSACASRTPAQHRCTPHGRLQLFVSADARCWELASRKPSRRSQRHGRHVALFGLCEGRQRHMPSSRLPAASARADTGNAPAGRPGLSNLCRSIQQGFFEVTNLPWSLQCLSWAAGYWCFTSRRLPRCPAAVHPKQQPPCSGGAGGHSGRGAGGVPGGLHGGPAAPGAGARGALCCGRRWLPADCRRAVVPHPVAGHGKFHAETGMSLAMPACPR